MDEQYKMIVFNASIGPFDLTKSIAAIRTELNIDNFINIVEVTSNATARDASGKIEQGLVLSVDTIRPSPTDFWRDRERYVDTAHTVEKQVFFQILTEDTIDKFGAIWE